MPDFNWTPGTDYGSLDALWANDQPIFDRQNAVGGIANMGDMPEYTQLQQQEWDPLMPFLGQGNSLTIDQD